jgi:hypothetical protein
VTLIEENRITMALDKNRLAENLKIGHILAYSAPTTEEAQKQLAENMSIAIYEYLIQADIRTDVIGEANGGINSSTPVGSPGTITKPAMVIGNGIGTLQ